jgi:hypothetical protein
MRSCSTPSDLERTADGSLRSRPKVALDALAVTHDATRRFTLRPFRAIIAGLVARRRTSVCTRRTAEETMSPIARRPMPSSLPTA